MGLEDRVIRNPLEKFVSHVLPLRYPGAEIFYEPFKVECRAGALKGRCTLPDFLIRPERGSGVLLEVTMGRLENSDPKQRQKKILGYYVGVNREYRALVMYLQNFLPETVGASFGILDLLLGGKLDTCVAQREIDTIARQRVLAREFRFSHLDFNQMLAVAALGMRYPQ